MHAICLLQFFAGGGSINCTALSSARSGLKPCNIKFRFLVHKIMCTCLSMTNSKGINTDKALHLHAKFRRKVVKL